MKFRAAILNHVNEPLIIDDIQCEKLSIGQVLIKIEKAGICRSQIFEIDGHRGHDRWLPHLLGHEAVGQVIDIGPGVSTVKVGDNVVLSWIKSKGISSEPAKYKWRENILNSGRVTTFSEYSVVSEDRCLTMDKVLTDKVGPSLGCAMPTGYGISLTLKELISAQYVAIIGLGGIGMSALLGVVNETKSKVIAVDLDEFRLQQARRIGADFVVNSKNTDSIKDVIYQITNNQMCDVVIECSGSSKVLEDSLNLINNNGIVKFVSHPKSGDLLTIDPFELILGKRIEGSWGGGVNPDEHFIEIAKKISNNKVFLDMYAMKNYSLEEINQALNDLRYGKVLRPVLTFT